MSRKIYHVISGLSVGGAEMFLLRLVKCLKASGDTHVVVSLTLGGELLSQFSAAQIQVISLDFKKNPVSTFASLFRLFRKQKPDIVQTWMYHADLIGGLAARLAGLKNIIWGVRTTELSANARSTRSIRWLCARLSSFVPAVIVCAANASRRNHAGIGYDDKLMRVIPNGFEVGQLRSSVQCRNELRQACGFASDQVIVGGVGRFCEEKDFENFIQAAGCLAGELPDVRFVLVGRDLTPANTRLCLWLEASNCRERFTLLGERKDVAACLAAMDIFCLSSMTEGFPNVLGEAMAMGLPCVTTDVGDAALLLDQQGLLVPPRDSLALAEGLRTMVKLTAQERASLGRRAYERINDEFSMERTSRRFEELYRQLVGRS